MARRTQPTHCSHPGCFLEVQFDSPQDLCEVHWYRWWFHGYPDAETLVRQKVAEWRRRHRQDP